MSVVTRTTAKSYFDTGDKPTAAQYIDLIDSSRFDEDFSTFGKAFVSAATTASAISQLGVIPTTAGGTGTGTAFTLGSVVFAGASGVYFQDNANFFWENTGNYLGIGTASPTYPVHTFGAGGSGNAQANFQRNSASNGAKALIAFGVSSTPGLYGATITHERTGSNS